MHRLFVALRPPPAMRAQLLATMAGVPAARWQDDDQLHLTLRFIGEVDRHQAEDIAAALGSVHRSAVDIALQGVGHFGPPGRPNSLWAGVPATDPLTALHHTIDRALVRVGVAPDTRAYRPHITVARPSRSAGPIDPWLAEWSALHAAPVTLDRFALYESHLGHGGSTYEAVTDYRLG